MIQLHCGYYEYNNKIYINRQELLDDMLVYGNLPVHFKFNDEIFRKIDWQIEPDISLQELYRIRAQQLRDTYEYIILSYSGGADSHEVLNVFLDNDIFIDEIQVVHQSKAIKNIDRSLMLNDQSLKILLEYEYAALPALQEALKKSPNTKLTLLDSSDFLVDDVTTRKFSFIGMDQYATNASFLASTTPFVRNFFQQHHNNKTIDTGKKTCFLRGTEKPNLRMFRNELIFHFSDVTMHSVKLIQMGEINNIYTFESFFWTPDVPLIPIKQSHVIKQALETNAAFYASFMLNQEKLFRHQKMNSLVKAHDQEQNFQRSYTRLIYKHWNDEIFKAPKHSTESSDLKIVGMLTNNSSVPRDALKEQNEYFFKKYAKIDNKNLLNKHIYSDRHSLGVINAKWS